MHVASPAIHTARKSLYTSSLEDETISAAVYYTRGIPQALPVLFGGKVIGITLWDWATDTTIFKRITHKQWCGFNGYDDIIGNAIAGGRYYRATFFKDISGALGGEACIWSDAWGCPGIPQPGDWSGTANTARQFGNTTPGGLYAGGQPTSGESKHVIGWSESTIVGSGTSNTAVILYDRVLAYDGVSWTTSLTTMTNTLPATRYISAGQPGLMIQATVILATGATTGNLSSLHYTNNAGTAAQSVPTTATLLLSANTTGVTSGSTNPALIACPTNNSGANSPMPYVPLSGGDSGVQKIEDLTSSSINTGTLTWALLKPLAFMWNHGQGQTTQVDLTRSLFTLERVYDTACVSFNFLKCNGGTTKETGYVSLAWG